MRKNVCIFTGLFACAMLVYGCQSVGGEWQAIQEDALTETQAAQRDRALAARDELFRSLMGHLQTTLQAEGTPAAIRVCKEIAPALAEDIGTTHGVTIGRTSFRLRNPENAPPPWAVPYVEQRRDSPLFLNRAEDGAFAALLPIPLKAPCMQCHGPREVIAPDVREVLAAAYPDDEAVGFQEGDLRGWFHVVVPTAP